MDFSEPPRPPRAESIVPMINVVFLLLIFFLMTSNLAQPEPFEITPPQSVSTTKPEVEQVLYVDKTGRTSFQGNEGDAALSALAAISGTDSTIQIRADAGLEAVALARLLNQLAHVGFGRVELVVAPK
ncbi:ExbD/TolR family protein [Ruegeria halocynthiae]|uniref:ExbD/TolR family protein n=1 Tax=Ruegeria halocynthiae TaxID=985054 RepID=UPI00056BCA84|nr:biopolymer transporter ExbD [Ruegeria halocynthiae]